MQWLDAFCFLPLAERAVLASYFEERRRGLDKPFGLNRSDIVHVLARRLHQRMVDDMLCRFAE